MINQTLPNPDNEPREVFPVPSERQMKWQETEFYAFFHYGMNTYTGLEWGNGDEDNNTFAPTQKPDPEQWLRLCKKGGMKGGIAVSILVLEALKALNPEAELYFIVGADTVCSMRTWKAPERIFAVCTILSAIREDQIDPERLKAESEALARDFGARILPVTIPNIGISSTDIRERAAAGKSIHYLVPSALESYIIETGIYK